MQQRLPFTVLARVVTRPARLFTFGASRTFYSNSKYTLNGRWKVLASTAAAVVVPVLVISNLMGNSSPIHLESPAPSSKSSEPVTDNPSEDNGVKQPINNSESRIIKMSEVEQHDSPVSCWVVIDGNVWDVTHFAKEHPGGSKIILSNAGKDVTNLFKPIHPANTLERNLKPENMIGRVDPATLPKTSSKFEEEQERIRKARENLPPVETILGLDDMEEVAQRVLSIKARAYYNGGSDDERTLRDNASTFKKCRFIPRVMIDVSKIAPQTILFGHPDGEMTLVRGASATGVVQGISAASSLPLDEILNEKAKLDKETGYKMPMVYQVYVQPERRKTERLVKEAIEGGCSALLVTVDTAVLGNRQKNDKEKGQTGEVSSGRRMEPCEDFPAYHDPKFDWDDLKWIKSMSNGIPIYLKGVASIEDVKLAKKHGLAGVILSNHGGRQLNGARTAFDSLRQIHKQDSQLLKEIEVYVDGGFRRGTDVLAALCLGAKGVGFGRNFLWGQAAYGEQGVIRTVRILESEIILGMRLLGAKSISDLKPEMLECIQEGWGLS